MFVRQRAVPLSAVRVGDLQVPVRTEGDEQLGAFIRSFGSPRLVGIEGTNSYGVGLTRYLMAHAVEIR